MAKMNWDKSNKLKNIGKPEKASWGENWLKKYDSRCAKPVGAAAVQRASKPTGG